MLRIRLRRVGRKHDPSYQLIVAEKGRGPQTGDYVEKVGTYDARSDEYELEDERISYWISEGAQPTDTVHNLLAKAGIIDEDTVNPLPQKSPVTQDEEVEEEDEEGGEDTDEDDETGDVGEEAEPSENDQDDESEDSKEKDGEQEGQDKDEDTDDDETEDEEGDDEDEA